MLKWLRLLAATGLACAALPSAAAVRHLALVNQAAPAIAPDNNGTFLPALRTTDDNAQPVSGAVTLTVPSSCGAINGASSSVVTTGTDGVTPHDFHTIFVPTRDGICTVTASIDAGEQIKIDVDVYAPQDMVLTLSPDSVTTVAGGAFDVSATLLLHGAPVANLPVNWFAVGFSGGATASVAASAATDASGVTVAHFTGNSLVGQYRVGADFQASGGPDGSIQVQQSASGGSSSVSVPAVGASGFIDISIAHGDSGCQLADAAAFPYTRSSHAPLPAGFSAPFGQLHIVASGCVSGRDAEFDITFPQPLPPNATLWREAWSPVPGAVISGSTVRLHAADGAPSDSDGRADGQIWLNSLAVLVPGGVHQDMWWAGPTENGWGMSLVEHDDRLFGALYIYDDAGKPVWHVLPGGDWDASHTKYSGALYKPTSAPYYAYNQDAFYFAGSSGYVTITFLDANNATLDYTIGSVSGRKSIQREIFAPAAALTSTRSDLWWGNLGQNGWGITVLQQGTTLFSVWYTYDASGNTTWFVMPGGSWTASDTYEGHLYRTAGSPWATAYDASKLKVFDVGTYRIQFNGDSAATFTYSADGHGGSIPLVREPF